MKEKPRTVSKILQFMKRLEDVLQTWDPSEKRSLMTIADQTYTDVPYVLELLFGGSYDFDVYEPLPYKSIEKAFYLLQQRMKPEIESQEKQQKMLVDKVLQVYKQLKNRVHDLEEAGNYRVAYKTMNYFLGVYLKYLDDSIKLEIYSKLLKLGCRSDLNFQELAEWIKRASDVIFKSQSFENYCIQRFYEFLSPNVDFLIQKFGDKARRFFKALINDIEKFTKGFNIYAQFEELFLKSHNIYLDHSSKEILQSSN